MNPRPLFSIIIPVFTIADELIDGLLSLQDQWEKNIEIIYGLEAPDPASEEVIAGFITYDPRIKQLTTDKPRCLGAIYNDCLKLARGRYIIFLHASDVLDSDLLDTIAEDHRKASSKHHCYLIHRVPDLYSETGHHFYTHLKGIDTHGHSWNYIFHRSLIAKHKLKFPLNSSPDILAQFSTRYTRSITDPCKIEYHDEEIELQFQNFQFPDICVSDHIKRSQRLLRSIRSANQAHKKLKHHDRCKAYHHLHEQLLAFDDAFLLYCAIGQEFIKQRAYQKED